MGKPQVSFTKRQREQAKRERQQLKLEKRAQRKLNPLEEGQPEVAEPQALEPEA